MPTDVLPNASDDAEVKALARVILFVKKHWTLFGVLASGILALWTAFQTMRSDVANLKVDVVAIKTDVAETKNKVTAFDKKLTNLLKQKELASR